MNSHSQAMTPIINPSHDFYPELGMSTAPSSLRLLRQSLLDDDDNMPDDAIADRSASHDGMKAEAGKPSTVVLFKPRRKNSRMQTAGNART